MGGSSPLEADRIGRIMGRGDRIAWNILPGLALTRRHLGQMPKAHVAFADTDGSSFLTRLASAGSGTPLPPPVVAA